MTRDELRARPWNRLLWGVRFYVTLREKPILLGDAWSNRSLPQDAPTRALLFDTRKAAREWCRAENAKWPHHLKWRVVPVRVRETVEEV